MSKSLDKNPSSSFLKPTTPKMFQNDSSNSTSEGTRHRRVEDESSIEKEYIVGEVLGTGAFGVVKEVTHKLTHQKFAMKIINKDKVCTYLSCYFSLISFHELWVCNESAARSTCNVCFLVLSAHS